MEINKAVFLILVRPPDIPRIGQEIVTESREFGVAAWR
jgi:hypothetical protein